MERTRTAEAIDRPAAQIPRDGRVRVVVDRVEPEIDGGRFPIKRTVGETVRVTADVFADGHDVLAGVVKYRYDGEAWSEAPLVAVGNDAWSGGFSVDRLGQWEYTVEGWVDRFGSWLKGLIAKAEAGQDVSSELLEGAEIVERAAGGDGDADDNLRLLEIADKLRGDLPQRARVAAARDPELRALMDGRPDRSRSATYERTLRVVVDPVVARYGSWYEMFPRSCSPDPSRSGTLREAEARLPEIAEMAFDVLYLPPVHPIGHTNRKGRNNSLVAAATDPGSPWAIGSEEGGHTAIDPGLGTIEDFDRFVRVANRLRLQVALDIAFQASPDHPWVREHPEWFKHRPDGTIKYAENPPKKYQDIYPIDFDTENWEALWAALLDVFRFWIDHGVTLFRVDNPHTKSFRFWEWCIATIQKTHPDAVFLSEAFTRPKVMRYLAKAGFSQSYTYFTWRNHAHELRDYLTELTRTELQEYLRPNLFVNTPDILNEYLVSGGRPAFEVRLILAATLAASYGIYSGFELCENLPVRPGSEEYLDSEKYQIKPRDYNAAGNLKELIARVNDIRRAHPALQQNATLAFYNTDTPQLLCYGKTAGDDRVYVVASTDPHWEQAGWVQFPTWEVGLGPRDPYVVEDLLDGAQYTWTGEWNFVRLGPNYRMAHIFVGTTIMNDPYWYKDAIIYEAHVRSFFDSTNDGIGDFPGLTMKLPYLRDLGINCLWLLPFYPSPLRDDGYDISDYRSVNPMYGTIDDFKRFVEEAHRLGIRVLTEVVVNHTSDQHPWFQRARHAPKGSPEREFYVWSDTDAKYAETRIIFIDTEKSNWTYDPVAGQYYWHRFFSHQPDLNWDNPEVLHQVVSVMRYWLDMGVDALRLDAIPYLIEREGTINENLPETHDVLKAIRRELDIHHPGRVLLAEANQWPSDVRPYFGDGDECHMAFHFPLMPRMFMGLRLEERHPIVEIMNQTPEIPEPCQWAIFLRNHDELTLEMVTDEERDYMYAQYAAEPQMRLNLGIRRRLAPLMENSRPRIELMTSLLFTMPGTPVIYYGDEIGMGDNVYLGDRNGVRTPMQWSSDRNGGFSRADPGRLFLPAIMDPVYGYDAINVEAQERSPFSLLHWMKRMIALRKQHPVFGRGSIEFISTSNRKVLTYVRRYDKDIVLCVANLSRTVQPVEIDLPQFAGLTPVEMLGQTQFPRIGDLPYFLTLSPYGFYWFQLQEVHTPLTARTAPLPEEAAPVPALFAGVVWDSVLDGSMRLIIERHALVPFLQRQRWFGGKARQLSGARFVDWVSLRKGAHPSFLTVIEAEYRDGSRDRYLLPLAMSSGADAERIDRDFHGAVLARITGARKGLLYDGLFDDGTCLALLTAMHERRGLTMRQGRVEGTNDGLTAEQAAWDALTPIARSASDQSNTSILFSRRLIMKVFRRLEAGPNPEIEMGRYLMRRHFTRVPPLLGAIEYARRGEEPTGVAVLQEFVHNQGNGWQVTIDELGRYFERRAGRPLPTIAATRRQELLRSPFAEVPQEVRDAIGTYVSTADVLGRRTGELHLELGSAAPGDRAFAAEPLTPADAASMAVSMQRHAREQLDLLERGLDRLDDRKRALARGVLNRRQEILHQFDELRDLRDAPFRIRIHGDYHLGQVLITEGDVVIIDFEGEPARPLAERRAKSSPLRDVAGMLRSVSYASFTALGAATQHRPEDYERLAPWAEFWETWVSAVFLRAYLAAVGRAPFIPSRHEDLDLLLQTFTLDKAVYELAYELNNRPDWVHIPLTGLLRLRSPLHA